MFDKAEIKKLTPAQLRQLTDKTPPKNPPNAKPIEPIYKGETAVLIATGPSLSDEQLDIVKEQHEAGNCRVITFNNVYERAPYTDLHLSCDAPWWRWYYPRSPALQDLPCPKYTWFPDLAKKFKIDYIRGEIKPGLSRDPGVVRINHGSSPMCINLAVHYGFKKLLLIGHDMKFAPDYNAARRNPGSTPRHYFGEYPGPLQHWPSVKVGLSKPGVIDGMIETYAAMVPDLKEIGMEIVNCTPGSALTVFPMSTLEKEFSK
ncbi:hypothetical protein LCGC14_1345220 [marine sediment metagenome]|uniref:DUF115 domain-containing protein n=1 Tax=marine sediment metagenome TaxID=412755 RepID=A0A0F9MTE4_9ZZZZ